VTTALVTEPQPSRRTWLARYRLHVRIVTSDGCVLFCGGKIWGRGASQSAGSVKLAETPTDRQRRRVRFLSQVCTEERSGGAAMRVTTYIASITEVQYFILTGRGSMCRRGKVSMRGSLFSFVAHTRQRPPFHARRKLPNAGW